MKKTKSTISDVILVGQGFADVPLLRSELEKHEYAIQEEKSASAALSKIGKSEIPVVIYQQSSQKEDDVFVKQCASLLSHPCVIVLTKNKSVDNIRELFKQGAFDCLIYPVEASHFMHSIRRGLEKRKAMLYGIKDPLTGLYNRYSFKDMLKSEIDRAKRYDRHLSLLMIDIDYFKKINDEFGHIIGDHILVRLASILQSSFRKTDIITRFGGEEFAIILPETEISHATILAERIRRKIQQHDYSELIGAVHLTVSIGISNYHTPLSKPDVTLLHSADQALYAAKRNGRNKVCISLAPAEATPVEVIPKTKRLVPRA